MGGLRQLKNPVTSSGIEQATFQVPQRTMLLRVPDHYLARIVVVHFCEHLGHNSLNTNRSEETYEEK
jgi:hypothetical protein